MRIKCPHCNGKGFSELNSAVNMTCGWCMGQGELDLEIVPTEPLTEQEYLQSCNTEQLAEWLSEKLDYCQIMWYWACDKCTWSKKHESCMNDKEKWMEWLKQPHKKE